jgi:hypothetical protein
MQNSNDQLRDIGTALTVALAVVTVERPTASYVHLRIRHDGMKQTWNIQRTASGPQLDIAAIITHKSVGSRSGCIADGSVVHIGSESELVLVLVI